MAATIDSQFMWGDSLMIAPALDEQEYVSTIYFPPGVWFHVVNYTRIDSPGKFFHQFASYYMPNVYYRAGSVVPIQEHELTTDQTREGNFSLMVVLENENASAKIKSAMAK